MKMKVLWIGAFFVLGSYYVQAGEHAGQEHGGQAVTKEGLKKNFTAKDIKQAITKHIKSLEKEGVFTLTDVDDHDTVLNLKFVKIHDPVRKLGSGNYFACTDFSLKDTKEKLYDVDFWLEPKKGKLVVYKTKVHKDPRQLAGKWVKKERYTFKGDDIVPVQ